MKDYIFILGRDPELSILELASYLNARKVQYKIKARSKTAALVSLPELNFAKVIKGLGGTVKIARVISDLDSEELYSGSSNKIKYGISVYDDSDVDELKEYIKTRMRQEKLKAAYKRSSRQEPFLMPNDVIRHELMNEGFELVVYDNMAARTIAVFNPFEYEKRDTERPKQRELHMLSIRLAKILINLSMAKEGDDLIDPFCGYGILLQEAMLMGVNAIGFDISRECAEASKVNLAWIAKKYKSSAQFKIFNANSRQISRFIEKADAAATEPYMGPLLNKIPVRKDAIKTIQVLEPLYRDVLKELAKVVKGNIAIIVPRFRLYSGERIKFNFERMLSEFGFKPVSALSEVKLPIIYTASDSKIEREIWVVRKL
ncbi:MAG: hypothetical protein PHO02_06895 [Candidatus Nanoarchaeia archaeon]|nr:hypothetical protein [Candidatus Nanoarchaeia archaeon]